VIKPPSHSQSTLSPDCQQSAYHWPCSTVTSVPLINIISHWATVKVHIAAIHTDYLVTDELTKTHFVF